MNSENTQFPSSDSQQPNVFQPTPAEQAQPQVIVPTTSNANDATPGNISMANVQPQPVVSPQSNPQQYQPAVQQAGIVMGGQSLQPLGQSDVSQSGLDYKVMDRRVSAFLLDVVLWVPVFIIASQHFGTYSVRGGMIYFNLTGIPFVVFALLFTAYYILFEAFAGGTLGKLAVGIRVLDDQGNKLSFSKSLIRNLLRIVDGFPYVIPNLTGFIIASTSDKKQRLGDKAAHTLVVRTDNPKPASKKAWLSLAALLIVGIAIIILVPASKSTSGAASNSSTLNNAGSSSSVSQNLTAKAVSDQVFNYVINGNTPAVYQLASPALRQVVSEAKLATGIQQIDMNIIGKPQPVGSQILDTSSVAQFVYNVQTTSQGVKPLLIVLNNDNGQWLVTEVRLEIKA